MEVNNIIHEMNEVIQEFNLLEFRMTDLRMKLSGLHAKVSYYLNTGKDLYEQHQETTGNNGEIHNLGMPNTEGGVKYNDGPRINLAGDGSIPSQDPQEAQSSD